MELFDKIIKSPFSLAKKLSAEFEQEQSSVRAQVESSRKDMEKWKIPGKVKWNPKKDKT